MLRRHKAACASGMPVSAFFCFFCSRAAGWLRESALGCAVVCCLHRCTRLLQSQASAQPDGVSCDVLGCGSHGRSQLSKVHVCLCRGKCLCGRRSCTSVGALPMPLRSRLPASFTLQSGSSRPGWLHGRLPRLCSVLQPFVLRVGEREGGILHTLEGGREGPSIHFDWHIPLILVIRVDALQRLFHCLVYECWRGLPTHPPQAIPCAFYVRVHVMLVGGYLAGYSLASYPSQRTAAAPRRIAAIFFAGLHLDPVPACMAHAAHASCRMCARRQPVLLPCAAPLGAAFFVLPMSVSVEGMSETGMNLCMHMCTSHP